MVSHYPPKEAALPDYFRRPLPQNSLKKALNAGYWEVEKMFDEKLINLVREIRMVLSDINDNLEGVNYNLNQIRRSTARKVMPKQKLD
jgi:hypothetical protein